MSTKHENITIWSPVEDCDVVCPSATGEGNAQLYIIALCYLIVSLLAAAEITYGVVVTHQQSKLFPAWLRNSLLVTCGVFTSLRGLVLLIPFSYTIMSLVVFNYVMPLLIQFLIYSLIVLFFVKHEVRQHDAVANKWRRSVYIIYGGFVAIMVVSAGLASYLIANNTVQKVATGGKQHNDVDYTTTVWTSIWFFIFCLLMVALGAKTYLSIKRIAMSHRKKLEIWRFLGLGAVYFCIFFARVVWDVLYAFEANPLQAWINSLVTDDNEMDPTMRSWYYSSLLVFYVVLEVVPSAFLIIMLHFVSVPRKVRQKPKKEFKGYRSATEDDNILESSAKPWNGSEAEPSHSSSTPTYGTRS